MKILLITNLYEPYARGGAEQVVKTVAEGLVLCGHEVVLLTAGPMRYGFFPREERGIFTFATAVGKVKTDKLRVLRFSPWNLYFVRNDGMFPKFVRLLARLWEMVSPHPVMVLRRVIKKERPDVIMTHNLVGLGMRIPTVIKKSCLPHIHTLHDVQLIHPSGLLIYGKEKQAERLLCRRWYERTMRRFWGSPDVVIAPSKWLLDFHTSRNFFPKSKTIVLPNPIGCNSNLSSPKLLPPTPYLPTSEHNREFTPRLSSEAGRQRAKRSYTLHPLRLLYAGQLEPHKGLRWLLDQTSKVKGQTLILEIAGSGSLENEIKKAAASDSEHIIFQGKLNQQKLYERFAVVDALVVPSLCYENAPRIISEALCAGLPVIASRLGGIPEMIRDGENGFLFEPGNFPEFKQALERLKTLFTERGAERRVEGLLPLTTDQYLDKLLTLM